MSTVGLELTNFIDPSLTWKTVSKGRNTSRRSRRPISTTLKSDQNQTKNNLKRPSGSESSGSDKSDISIQGRGFGSMEHIPIKKRRFLLRSPSPPPPSPNHPQESQEHDSGRCTLVPQTYCNGNTEPEVNGKDSSSRSRGKKIRRDCNGEDTACSFISAIASSEDFSGIAILAAAACSSGLDCTMSDTENDKMKREDEVSLACATNIQENITSCNATGQLKQKACVSELPSASLQNVCLNNTAEDGRNDISGRSTAEPNESVVPAISREESEDRCGSPDAKNKVAPHSEDSQSSLRKNVVEIAKKTTQDRGVKRDFRLHWDLNTVMDEWEHPIDDTLVDSSLQSVDIASTSAMGFKNSENVESATPPERCPANKSSEPVACVVPESKPFAESGGFTSVSTDLVTTTLKGNCYVHGSDSNASIEATSSSFMELKTPRDSDIGHSLSLGMNETVSASENLTKVAEGSSQSSLQTQVHEIDFSLLPLSENASCEIKAADCVHTCSKERNGSDENVKEGVNNTSEAVSTNFFGGDKPEITALCPSFSGRVSFKAEDTETENHRPLQHMSSVDADENESGEAFSQSAKSKSEMPMIDSKDSDGSNCVSKLDIGVALSVNNVDKQGMDTVDKPGMGTAIAKEIEEKPSGLGGSRCDHPMETVPNVTESLPPLDATSNFVKHLSCNTPENHSGRDSHISSEVSSQVTESNANVANAEGGYDSHLEDGELREPVGHFWEDIEGEDAETEHVDYDSDNREGIFYEAANDFAQLSGEVVAEDCEKQSCPVEKFSSADDEPNLAKSVEGNRSLQHPTTDAKVTESSKRDSPVLKSCSGVELKRVDRVEGDCKGCGRSGVEADGPGKEYDYEAPRNCRGASASGREFHFTERRSADPIRRSRSSNFDGVPHRGGSGESLARRRSPMQTDRFGGRSWDAEVQTAATDSVPEEEKEKISRVSEGTSPKVCSPRIISTSRSGYNPNRRGSPGERDNTYGMGMAKGRDISPDNNLRGRFDRFPNGVNRGFREGYRRPGMYEGAKSNGPMINHFGKRERSFSPMENRLDSHYPRSYRKSRSRSRTRSPDFRSEARMGRTRLPYQQPGHTADHIRERRSPVRVFNQRPRFDTMGSPGRLRSDDCMRPMMRPVRFHDTSTSSRDHDYEESDHYRRKPVFMRNNRRSRSRSRSCSPDFRSDARMGAMRAPYQSPADHTRGRRSPVRTFRPGQRYDNGDSGARLRSDDCVRPVMRPGRFNDTSQPGRGNDYNNGGDEYRRKPRNIFERIHPVRHYDGDGGGDGRRFQYNGEQDNMGNQNFRRNENYVRGGTGDRRPVQFRREDRGNVRYNSDRVFNSGPKQFGGMRDYSEDTVPRGVRP